VSPTLSRPTSWCLFLSMALPAALKIAAIIIVASWACAGVIRLLYPGVWKWIIDKFAFLWTPCNFCYHFLWPEELQESNRLKQHYILPMSFPNGDRDSFSKSFTDTGRRRKSEGSLRLERRNTELNVMIPSSPPNNPQSEGLETPTDSRSRSQSTTKKEGRRRGQGWARGGMGRGRGRGRVGRESGFIDYPFTQPNYDYPPDTIPDRVRGPSQFDIINPLQPSLGDGNGSVLLQLEAPRQGRQSGSKLVRSFSTNTTSLSGPSRPSAAHTNSSPRGRKSELAIPQATQDLLLDL
jgi:hypothetical protein